MASKAPFIGMSGSADLDQAVFGEPFHESLVHETARAELSARRRGTASTKTRGEVAMTGAKAWRQKGTGRARAGALSTPRHVGGGIAFGPKPRHYTVKVNRKARRRAMRAALTLHGDRETLAIADAAAFDPPSTKRAAEAIAVHRDTTTLVVLAREERITVDDLPENISQPPAHAANVLLQLPPEGLSIEEVEREIIRQALEMHGGNQTHTARYLDITRSALLYRMQKYGLAAPSADDAESVER